MTLSPRTLSSMHARESGDAWLYLLTITHADLLDPIRVVNNGVNIVSRGGTYLPLPFDLTLPSDDADVISRVQLSLDNIEYKDEVGQHRKITEVFRTLSNSPVLTVEVIRSSEPNEVVTVFPDMIIETADYDERVVTCTLSYATLDRINFPAHRFTQKHFPGLF